MYHRKLTVDSVIRHISYLAFGEPSTCCLCNSYDVSNDGICANCVKELSEQMASVCKTCGMPVPPPLELCHDCRTNLYYFDVQRSAGIYKEKLKHGIFRMKYAGQRWLSRPLGRLLSKSAQSFLPVDMVVPVPLSSSSRQKRGYNQAKDLAVEVAGNNSLVFADILVRKEIREHQSQLSRFDRWQNLRGTMKVSPTENLKGSRILVVDDVTTTGATLDEAARALKTAGAKNVCCVTLARTLRH